MENIKRNNFLETALISSNFIHWAIVIFLLFTKEIAKQVYPSNATQQIFTCSKSTIESLEKGVK